MTGAVRTPTVLSLFFFIIFNRLSNQEKETKNVPWKKNQFFFGAVKCSELFSPCNENSRQS